MALKEELTQKLGGKTLQEAENTEIYQALLQLTKERLQAVPAITGDRKLSGVRSHTWPQRGRRGAELPLRPV